MSDLGVSPGVIDAVAAQIAQQAASSSAVHHPKKPGGRGRGGAKGGSAARGGGGRGGSKGGGERGEWSVGEEGGGGGGLGGSWRDSGIYVGSGSGRFGDWGGGGVQREYGRELSASQPLLALPLAPVAVPAPVPAPPAFTAVGEVHGWGDDEQWDVDEIGESEGRDLWHREDSMPGLLPAGGRRGSGSGGRRSRRRVAVDTRSGISSSVGIGSRVMRHAAALVLPDSSGGSDGGDGAGFVGDGGYNSSGSRQRGAPILLHGNGFGVQDADTHELLPSQRFSAVINSTTGSGSGGAERSGDVYIVWQQDAGDGRMERGTSSEPAAAQAAAEAALALPAVGVLVRCSGWRAPAVREAVVVRPLGPGFAPPAMVQLRSRL